MEGTQISHVFSWARHLLWRLPWHVPGPLLVTFFLLWIVGLLMIGGAVVIFLHEELELNVLGIAAPGVFFASVLLVVALIREAIIKPIVGDAARYLSAAPANVKVRHAIREAGIDLLQKLHDKNKYDRIIVVGHSLGSVIGYDVLTHLWPRYNHTFNPASNPGSEALTKLEGLAHQLAEARKKLAIPNWRGQWPRLLDQDEELAAGFRAAQVAFQQHLRETGNAWRVTDFITLGSPLTYADVLIAEDDEQLREFQERRVLPICPPVLETPTGEKGERFSYNPPAKPDDVQPEKRRVPHHAAVFAAVRWTNLYFPARLVFLGDLIGGPLGGALGYGIRDVKLERQRGVRWLSHTKYWHVFPPFCEMADHLEQLRKALGLHVKGYVFGEDAEK